MSEFHALSLLGASTQQLEHSLKQIGSLPHIGSQRIRLVVDPTQVSRAVHLAQENQLPAIVVSVAGYPTGRHHSLIKASEARLAVQSGAEEIWVSIDSTITDTNTHLSEFITIREACPDPIEIGLIAPADADAQEGVQAAAQAASLAAFQRIISAPGAPSLEEAASPLDVCEVDLLFDLAWIFYRIYGLRHLIVHVIEIHVVARDADRNRTVDDGDILNR